MNHCHREQMIAYYLYFRGLTPQFTLSEQMLQVELTERGKTAKSGVTGVAFRDQIRNTVAPTRVLIETHRGIPVRERT